MLLTTPIVGVLIRFRADYTPKVAAVSLPDNESGNELVEDSPRNPFFGYLSMFVRVWRYEVSSTGDEIHTERMTLNLGVARLSQGLK